MTGDPFVYEIPDDVEAVILKLVASPRRQVALPIAGPGTLPGAQESDSLVVIGETRVGLRGTFLVREWFEREGTELKEAGTVPREDIEKNRKFVEHLISNRLINSAIEVSDGGLACALMELALADDVGIELDPDRFFANASEELFDTSYFELMFVETPGRYVLSASIGALVRILDEATKFEVTHSIPDYIAKAARYKIRDVHKDGVISDFVKLTLSELREAKELRASRLQKG